MSRESYWRGGVQKTYGARAALRGVLSIAVKTGVGVARAICYQPLGAGRGGADRTGQAAGRGSVMYSSRVARPGGQLRRELTLASGAEFRQAASGERHLLLLLSDGTVHSCGDNSRGQLGRRGAPRAERPGEHLHRGAERGAR